MTSLRVRDARRADITFLVEANRSLARETEDKVLDEDTLMAGVSAVFAHPERARYLVAELDGSVVGCLMVTYEWSDWRNGSFWWIQSVYVAAGARRRGVFKALHAETAQRARAAHAIGLRLYVEFANARAQNTYQNLGMRRCHYYMYETEF